MREVRKWKEECGKEDRWEGEEGEDGRERKRSYEEKFERQKLNEYLLELYTFCIMNALTVWLR